MKNELTVIRINDPLLDPPSRWQREFTVNKVSPFDMKHAMPFERLCTRLRLIGKWKLSTPNPDRKPWPNSVLMISPGLVWRVTEKTALIGY